jgi:hypothetical protein
VTPGYVYILRADNGLYKIGRSEDPEGRLAGLGVLPLPVVLLHRIATNDMVWLERCLHRLFSEFRVRGEWFALSASQVAGLLARQSWDRTAEDIDRPRATLYANIDADLKDRLDRLAAANSRTLAAQMELVLRRYLQQEEAKLNDPPP